MLVLSRKINESITIGENIRITLTSVRGRHARIAIEAPEDIPIMRSELLPAADPIPARAVAPRRDSRGHGPINPNLALGTTPRKP
ncbi:MAG: carbon storage regulator [Isosphaeraceae bacterium]